MWFSAREPGSVRLSTPPDTNRAPHPYISPCSSIMPRYSGRETSRLRAETSGRGMRGPVPRAHPSWAAEASPWGFLAPGRWWRGGMGGFWLCVESALVLLWVLWASPGPGARVLGCCLRDDALPPCGVLLAPRAPSLARGSVSVPAGTAAAWPRWPYLVAGCCGVPLLSPL
jgi:hypothetical protein